MDSGAAASAIPETWASSYPSEGIELSSSGGFSLAADGSRMYDGGVRHVRFDVSGTVLTLPMRATSARKPFVAESDLVALGWSLEFGPLGAYLTCARSGARQDLVKGRGVRSLRARLLPP